ncbi:hypothetical protein [uncultured Corynebacterium sp.]|uniref:hypothetical protein n=1 Tax=uncultured Corynebacterium sp. TaxID=159447 RepID=UPI0025EE554C|nr:hypothetical protein [uncultured Corynebacterium sp.]
MALTLRLDATSATLADLEAFLAAARAGGIGTHAAVRLDGTDLVFSTDTPASTPPATRADHPRQPVRLDNGVGDAAVRAFLEMLANRQNPQVD